MPLEHLQRPVRPFAAGRALAAALVGEEAATVVQEIDHRVGLVQHDHAPAVPRPRQPDFAGPLKSSGMSNSSAVSRPVLSPPGIAAFALRPFHTPPPNSSISSRHGDAQRGLVAARAVRRGR